jgi:proteasome accessory factor A
VTWGRSSNVFLRNGSRIYLDVGSHPEYATAECDDLVQLINHDRAGERILEDLIVDAEHRLASEGITGDIYLFKNNTDSHGNSYGCHENYLISRIGDFSKITDVLVPFLVSRQGAAHGPRGGVQRQPARRAHLGKRVVGDYPQSADHQYPRRAARRS